MNSVPVELFVEFHEHFLSFLCKLINLSFSTGIFPDCLKTAKVTPIYRNGDENNVGNYRPIFVLPFLSKIFGK